MLVGELGACFKRSLKGTKAVAVGIAHGRGGVTPTLKGLHSHEQCDPFRVGRFALALPVALPPATEYSPFRASKTRSETAAVCRISEAKPITETVLC